MSPKLEKYSYSAAIFLLMIMAISGCASVEPVKLPDIKPVEKEEEVSRNGWWNARFHIKWPQNEEPSWNMDLLIAHKTISPVLDQYKNRITLWRFHRRAARDQTGHQFSFIFYSSPETANQIYNTIRSDPLLREMKIAGLISQDIYDDTSVITQPDVEDTSDKNWSSQMKKSWPHYIMGVSKMWLDLITEISAQNFSGKGPSSLQENEAFYEEINERIKGLWQEEGRHALLHHLNAIFGYEPIIIIEKRIIRF
ncbi:MAG: hypothetical protein ISS66_16175 [Desulfobacteraceae bacterium]|nr:hypothetical protein [Desulfobacteraceae bacterium]